MTVLMASLSFVAFGSPYKAKHDYEFSEDMQQVSMERHCVFLKLPTLDELNLISIADSNRALP